MSASHDSAVSRTQAAASGVHEANPSSRVAQAATARTNREAKELEPDLVLSSTPSAPREAFAVVVQP